MRNVKIVVFIIKLAFFEGKSPKFRDFLEYGNFDKIHVKGESVKIREFTLVIIFVISVKNDKLGLKYQNFSEFRF